VLATLALAVAAPAGAQTPQLPDLVADPPLLPNLENYSDPSGTRLLLRFHGFVHNKGAGAVEVRGTGNGGNAMGSVVQRVFRTDGTWADQAAPGATLTYETGDGHRHWHLGQAARYSLWNQAKTAQVAPAQKVGFCFMDSERRETHGPSTRVYSEDGQNFCEQDNPGVGTVYMGISAGWRDIYQAHLAFQWVDVSDVSPGSYWLRADIDLLDLVDESDETNPPAYMAAASVIPGHVAKAVVGPQGLEQGEPAELTLEANTFGTPGAVQYRIASAPQHGTLDVAAGSWFAGPKVTYTPDPGYSGQDSFSYSARDSASAFPRNPTVATVAVGVQRTKAETVAISGAPAELLTGNGAQLQAKVVNGPPQATWSVEGVAGGNASVGTITAGGLYTAPATVPPGGSVTIRADGTFGGFAEVEVKVTKPKDPEPAPDPPPPPGPGPGPGPGDDHPHDPGTGPHTHNPEPPPIVTPPPVLPPLLSIPQVALNGRRAYVKTIPGRAGVVETKALVGKRRIALCRSSVPAGRGAVCKLWVPRRYRLRSVTLVVKLRVGSRAVATKRAQLPLAPGAAQRPR
jgi:hypothetical protein